MHCRPPEDLWSFFDSFSESHVAAMAPCMYHYGSPRNKVPFYGETGLNAGIMHMDLQVSNKYEDSKDSIQRDFPKYTIVGL